MQDQQLLTLLSMEKQQLYGMKSLRSHPKRRLIAESLNKLTDDEKIPDDVFALTMNIFDRFYLKSLRNKVDQNCQLIALSCHNLAKKLRSNMSINNENEQTSLILAENYTKDQIFDAEQLIVETLDWDLSSVVPHDYLSILIERFLSPEYDRGKVRLHTHILLSLSLCELNTLCIAPSLLASSCLKATLKSLYPSSNSFFYLDENLCQMFDIDRKELQQTQRLIEQLFQSCIQEVLPTRTRRCLAPIDTSNVKTTTSPRVK